ncbi:hypothetical protein lerEdw1_009510 [Lerista edwardsae]|nr:hypothetical protein lerEdw1_009510 [Lerista edwardsae]
MCRVPFPARRARNGADDEDRPSSAALRGSASQEAARRVTWFHLGSGEGGALDAVHLAGQVFLSLPHALFHGLIARKPWLQLVGADWIREAKDLQGEGLFSYPAAGESIGSSGIDEAAAWNLNPRTCVHPKEGKTDGASPKRGSWTGAKTDERWSQGRQVMLGRRSGHPSNPRKSYQPPQDAAPHRIPSPAAGDVGVFCDASPELRQPRKPTRGRKACKAHPRDSNGRDGETSTFIAGAADPPPVAPCCPSLSQAWSAYKAVFCCIVTCGGCFRDCRAGISHPYSEPLTDESKGPECNGHLPNSPARTSPAEKNWSQAKKGTVGSSFSYSDLKLKGIPVYQNRSPGSHADTDSCYKEPLPERSSRNSIEKPPPPSSHRSSEEHYSFHESDLEFGDLSGSMSSREIDFLIFRKLTELFSVHQIDELAKCTSDTVFLEKTNKISDLINSITQDYHLDEQDAECRLVRGIIRISTRKSRVRPRVPLPTLPSPEETVNRGNLPDSGNETMLESMLSSKEDFPVQISVETTADVKARNLRPGAYGTAATGREARNPTRLTTEWQVFFPGHRN